jgi:uncharacterized phage protein gp47/JayE
VPSFQPRNRVQIHREMIARVVARSRLKGLDENSVYYHLLAAASNEDAEQYVQMARLRAVFSLDDATGSDLDERAAEIVPGRVKRRKALFANMTLVFARPGTTGTIPIPVGSLAAAQDAEGQIRFRTLAAGEIADGETQSLPIPAIATIAGTRGNVSAGAINRMISRIAGVVSVTNPAAVNTGVDRESDGSFRARIKAHVQAMSRATPLSLETFANNVVLPNGRRVLHSRVVEPIIPNGTVQLYIDDGTGAVEEFDSSFLDTPDVFVQNAEGGEEELFTSEGPIRDDGSFVLEMDTGSGWAELVRGVDYELAPSLHQIELLSPLAAGASVRANYRHYTGLIRETQRIINGDRANRLRAPGVRGHGVQVVVLPAVRVAQSMGGAISVAQGFNPAEVVPRAKSAIQRYINTLGLGDNVIVSDIIAEAKKVPGVFDIRLSNLTGAVPPANQVILRNQVARITASAIDLT